MYFDHTERPHSLDNYEASLFCFYYGQFLTLYRSSPIPII
mgnify:CR=1 FL=1